MKFLKKKIAIYSLSLITLGLGSISTSYATTLRLTHFFKADSQAGKAASEFAEKVEEQSDGRIKIKVYPSSQLGDWVETHTLLMQGAIDIGLQPLSTNFDPRLAIAWFPYIAPTYEAAEKAYNKDGFAYKTVQKIIEPQNLQLLGVFADGMGGAGFTKEIKNPENPNEKHNSRIRVWPGGTTHQVLMQKLGYQVATLPWAELYTGMQTGVIDGQIGGSPELANSNFKDINKFWIQYNDHLELAWFVMNSAKLQSLPAEDQEIIKNVANAISTHRFQTVKDSDKEQLDIMRENGTTVVTFTDQELETLAEFTRTQVWPLIGEELGDDVMKDIKIGLGIED
ncbi:TRAP transporter substrate-binding protein DctP [Psychromonas aquatilis]|uniref:TRAP transporter substrate-binding protein DctP n=1 Tax=Psychromonas aquatilis TaxID=2005072 RepID=A0ABU9GNF4_9GAMM